MLRWLATPDGIALLTLIAGLFTQRVRASRRAATLAEVERYARIAAQAVTLAIRSGAVTDHDHAIERGLERFRALMRAAGLDADGPAESRALTAITDAVTTAGQAELGDQLRRLHDAADAALRRMGTPT